MADHPVGGLAAALRRDTRREHEATESSAFVAELMAGRLSLDAYVALLAQLREIYAALEDGEAQAAVDPTVAPFLHPSLHRSNAIAGDLDGLLGAGWEAELPLPTPATIAYAERIRAAAAASPPLFVAHHYVRYLGDLSGGQIVRRRLEEHYRLDAATTQFYAFPGIGTPKAFKDRYRAALDAAPWSDAVRHDIIAEARHAFALNGAVFDDLHRALALPA